VAYFKEYQVASNFTLTWIRLFKQDIFDTSESLSNLDMWLANLCAYTQAACLYEQLLSINNSLFCTINWFFSLLAWFTHQSRRTIHKRI